MASNLPAWPAADAVYQRAGVIANAMAKAGHVTVTRRQGRAVGSMPSPELLDLIDAMNTGDEERLKGLCLQHRRFSFQNK